MRILFLFILFAPLINLLGQDTAYAHEVLYELSSKKYHGRGYYKNGEIKASKYIAGQMKKIGLQTIGGSYMQAFPLNGNCISKTSLTINGVALKNGVQYLPNASNQTDKKNIHWRESEWGSNFTHVKITPSTKITDIASTIDHAEDILIIDTIQKGSTIGIKDIYSKIDINKIHTVIVMHQGDFNQSISSYQSKLNQFMVAYDKLPTEIRNVGDWFKLEFKTKAKLSKGSQNNVIGLVKGENQDSTIIVCGHYDHLGQIGKDAIFYGANDNACGIAMLLDMAKYFIKNKPKYNMLFIAFGGEEAGLVGSKYYVENPIVPLSKTKFVLNLDLVGTGHKGMTVVNATVFQDYFKKLTDINNTYNYLPQITRRGKAANSDHYFFTEAGIPSFFGYFQGDRSSYHDVFDVPETLPLTKYEDGRNLFIKFLEAI